MADRGECLVGLDFIGGHYRPLIFGSLPTWEKRAYAFDPRGWDTAAGSFGALGSSGGNADYLGIAIFGFAGEYWHCHVLDRIGASVAASPIGTALNCSQRFRRLFTVCGLVRDCTAIY